MTLSRHLIVSLTLAISALSLPLSVSAAEGIPGVDDKVPEPADCRFYGGKDPFEPAARMVILADHKSHCIDTRRRRSIQILSKDQNYWTIANFRHNNQFWVAKIPVTSGSVSEVRFVEELFPAPLHIPAAHTFLWFQMDPNQPVILTPQLGYNPDQIDSRKQEKVRDVILTIEAVAQPGFKYDLFKGEQGAFSVAYRMTSLQERAQWTVQIQNHTAPQWKLNLPASESAQLLQNSMVKSNDMGLKYKYDTLTRNCTNEVFRLLDTVLPFQGLERVRDTVFFRETIPSLAVHGLAKRKLIDSTVPSKNPLGTFDKDADVRQSLTTEDWTK